MKTLHIQTATNPAVLAKRLFKLERRGKYEEALGELADIWPNFDALPEVTAYEPYAAAEILLRCGSLIGLHGHNAQIPDAQISSKNLLTNARDRFLQLHVIEKAAECENHLAFAFWRTGEFNEAENWVEEALGRCLSNRSDARLYSHLIQSLIYTSCKRYDEIIKIAENHESDFRRYADPFLTGSFYTNLALAYKNVGDFSTALGYYELAKSHHQQSRHKIYLATVENNLAHLYLATGKFHQAHESIDNATRIFKQLKDKTREGYSFDTKALVYFAESKFTEALKTVEKALTILRKSENSAYLIETLLTKAKILLFVDSFSDAVLSLSDAVVMARVQTGDAAAIRLIQEFEAALDAKNTPAKKVLEDGDLELVLPKSIAEYSDYRGIWINNTQLESIGLVKGSLAIVVNDTIKRGDLIALTKIANNQVICGFYDADFGIVCLERGDGEPQLFDEKDIKILGKIVGVCSQGKNSDGAMLVDTIIEKGILPQRH